MLEQPLENTKSPITTPKKYEDHSYHPNIGSTPLPPMVSSCYKALHCDKVLCMAALHERTYSVQYSLTCSYTRTSGVIDNFGGLGLVVHRGFHVWLGLLPSPIR